MGNKQRCDKCKPLNAGYGIYSGSYGRKNRCDYCFCILDPTKDENGGVLVGQLCPYDDCQTWVDLSNDVGWKRCPHCNKLFWYKSTGGDFEDYHCFYPWERKDERPDTSPLTNDPQYGFVTRASNGSGFMSLSRYTREMEKPEQHKYKVGDIVGIVRPAKVVKQTRDCDGSVMYTVKYDDGLNPVTGHGEDFMVPENENWMVRDSDFEA